MNSSVATAVVPRPGERVVVAMSGGVDSSVAAALLVAAGYEVVGVSMRLWGGAPTGSGCCSLDDFLDARRVAAKLRIPFYVMDFRDEFRSRVVEPFIDEYLAGRTPNPCVRCNQFVKFDGLWQRVRELGGQWLATGHYARCLRSEDGTVELWTAVDAAKDQSYFLFGVEPQALAHTLFPLGELNKAEVRAKARELGLAVADKPESQEICFAAPRQHAAFVAQHAGDRQPRPGKVVDLSGQVIADHDGVHHFTIGQRRGLGISAPDPLYVTAIDGRSGKVTVGPRQATFSGGLLARRANWLARCTPGTKLQMKIRSRFAPTAVVLDDAGEDHFAVRAEAPLSAVTPGQAAVLYDRQRVVGGGWIERAI